MSQTFPNATNTSACPNCGVLNTVDRAVCENCQTPLTAYAGQLTGQEETTPGKLAAQVTRLNTRPMAVTAIAVFDILFALFWPLASVLAAFATRPKINEEQTNYIHSALGAIGPIFSAIVLLPVAAALLILAWAAWTQRPWAWIGNAGALALFGVCALLKFSGAGFFWVAVAGVLAYLWLKSETKAWFGYF